MTQGIINKSKNLTVARRVRFADSFFLRLKGLMFSKSIGEDAAWIFRRAPSIHTFFMRFPIDVVFLDKDKRVIKIKPAVQPWRIVSCLRSSFTLELPPHKSSSCIELGDTLTF